MASKDSLRIADSLAHISKVCGYIARLLKVLLVAYCFCILLFYGAVAITYLAPGVLPFNTLPINLSFLALFLSIITGAVALFVLISVAEDIAKGSSPFTLTQARRIKVIGILLLISVVLKLFIPTGSVDFLETDAIEFGFVPRAYGNGTPTTTIDISTFITAIICFFLSYVFKYGALLQRLSDDTV